MSSETLVRPGGLSQVPMWIAALHCHPHNGPFVATRMPVAQLT